MHPAPIAVLVFEALQANAGADFVRQLVEAFAYEAPLLIDQLRSAAAQGDSEGFETTAHSLKSNGITFGASRLAEMAGGLELQGLSADRGAVDQLANEVAAAVASLRLLARQ
jgi:HPt (histidine-containing phosphotransfer) domain-containing protein